MTQGQTWANAVGKEVQIDLLNTGLPQTLNFAKKEQKMQHL